MKTILCYGDSNTWGYEPATGRRYPPDTRWTGVCARILGEDYNILEEGLSGRTTVFDAFYDPSLNGEACLEAELRTHAPLDLVVLMLGTNDLQLGHTAWEASRGVGRLVKIIRGNPDCFINKAPRVLLVSPIHVGEGIKRLSVSPMAARGREESLQFAPLFRLVAIKNEIDFLDGGAIVEPSPRDCEHMDENGHALFGAAVAKKILGMLA